MFWWLQINKKGPCLELLKHYLGWNFLHLFFILKNCFTFAGNGSTKTKINYWKILWEISNNMTKTLRILMNYIICLIKYRWCTCTDVANQIKNRLTIWIQKSEILLIFLMRNYFIVQEILQFGILKSRSKIHTVLSELHWNQWKN